MTLTISMVDVAEKIFDLLTANTNLGLAVVYYGDQNRLADTPAACVEPSIKNNNLKTSAMARKLDPEIITEIIIYHSPIQSTQVTRLECDRFGEAVETFINTKRDLDGLIIHGYVTTLESGYVEKTGQIMRACRLTHKSITQGYLPS